MISQDLLDILRCPLSPSSARLRLQGDHLECERCALRFLIKDGFPILVVEEAELPSGCESISQLPCQREEKPKVENGGSEGPAQQKAQERPPLGF